MKTRLLAVAVALVCASFAAAADEENPYKKAKVGDFSTYTMVTKIANQSFDGTVTHTVTAKDDKEVTIKKTIKVAGGELPSQEEKIDLTKPFDPTKAGNVAGGAEAKVEKLKDGTEKIKVGDKEYATKWETYKIKAKAMGQEIEAETKVWMTKDLAIPVVKVEMTAEVMGNKMEMTMELKESGNKTPEKK